MTYSRLKRKRLRLGMNGLKRQKLDGSTFPNRPRGAGRKGVSDTSTKRAEEIAYNLQLSGVSGSTWRATEVDASNMLRSLAAERDALRAERDMLKRDNEIMVGMINDMATIVIKARAALGEKK